MFTAEEHAVTRLCALLTVDDSYKTTKVVAANFLHPLSWMITYDHRIVETVRF